jgi:hypothetical protein
VRSETARTRGVVTHQKENPGARPGLLLSGACCSLSAKVSVNRVKRGVISIPEDHDVARRFDQHVLTVVVDISILSSAIKVIALSVSTTER